jgi:glycosyltransferase involved in cell wall biosynthesis
LKLVLIHQHDPTIPHVAGIGTFINTFIRNAPDDLEIQLLGVTDQADRFPVGQWHSLSLGGKAFRFFPMLNSNPVHVPLFPLSFRILWSLYRYRKKFDLQGAIIESHRIEPVLGFLWDKNPKVCFLHGHNMKDFYNPQTEVRWGKFPWLYFGLEKWLLPKFDHIYIVREDAIADYQEKYQDKADDISFLPTWVDEEVFSALDEEEIAVLKQRLIKDHAITSPHLFLFVGRFEGQKDPFRLLQAFKKIRENKVDAALVLIGEGSLKAGMQAFVTNNELDACVRFLPPMSQQEIGEWMNVADALCLSSAFEGMPRVVVESLYCGLPVVSTAVGESWRLIGDEKGGRLVTEPGVEAFADAMTDLLDNPPSRESCRQQVEAFTAKKVLAPVYQYYRNLLRIKA